jgi:hypothetical protein
MSWRGTLQLVALAALALFLLLFLGRNHTRSLHEPLFDNNPEAADKIVIEESGGSLTLLRKGGVWQIEGDPADRADPRLVDALLHSAASLTPLDAIPPGDLIGPLTLSSLGLAKPKRSLTIRSAGTRTLHFGIEGAAAGQLYARLDSGGAVYLIPGGIAAQAFIPSNAFRDRRLTALTADHLGEASISRHGALQQLRIVKDRRGWQLASPVVARADQEAVTAWLKGLLSASVVNWLPGGTDSGSCGLEAPSAVFTLRGEGESTPVTISLGSQFSVAGESFYARCSDRPGICTVTGISPALAATPAALRSKNPQTVPLDTVDKIEISTGDGGRRLLVARKKGSDDWQVVEGGSDDLSGMKVEEWYRRLSSLKASGFEPATPDRLAARGLDAAPLRIRLIAHLSENTAEESAGDMVLGEYAFGTASDGTVAMREGDSSDLMLLPENALELAGGPEGYLSNR